MNITEEEARTKWCPFARGVTQSAIETIIPVAFNRRYDDKVTAEHKTVGALVGACAGSRCMAWRWTTLVSRDENGAITQVSLSKIEGRCGLAGAA